MSTNAIHSVAQGVVHNVPPRLGAPDGYDSLATFIGDTLPKQLSDIEREPWHLLGREGPLPPVARIRATLANLHAVLAELAWGKTTADAVAREARRVRPNKALDRVATLARRRAEARHRQSLSLLERLARQRGVNLATVTSPDSEAAATSWPPLKTAVLVELEALADLDAAQAEVTSLLTEASIAATSVTIIPMLKGKTLPRFSAIAFPSGKVFPDPSAADEWQTVIPPPHDTPLTDAATAAHQALQELSALA